MIFYLQIARITQVESTTNEFFRLTLFTLKRIISRDCVGLKSRQPFTKGDDEVLENPAPNCQPCIPFGY